MHVAAVVGHVALLASETSVLPLLNSHRLELAAEPLLDHAILRDDKLKTVCRRQQGASTYARQSARIVVSTITGITVLPGFASFFVYFTLCDSDTSLRYFGSVELEGRRKSLH